MDCAVFCTGTGAGVGEGEVVGLGEITGAGEATGVGVTTGAGVGLATGAAVTVTVPTDFQSDALSHWSIARTITVNVPGTVRHGTLKSLVQIPSCAVPDLRDKVS